MISSDVPDQNRALSRLHGPHVPTSDPERRARQSLPATSAFSLAACGLIFAGAVVAVFLAGGPPQGTLGIFLLLAGAALVLCPPKMSVDGRLWLALGALVLCGALAFLPEGWFTVPAWRSALEAAPAIALPRSVSPVPWQTGFWLAVLALSGLTGLFLLAHPVRSKGLEWYALAAVVVCGSYAALAMIAKQTGWHYPFDGGAAFGFFPNRNHTATLLITGSVLSMGLLTVAFRERHWKIALVTAAGLTLCVVALFFFSTSRGGVVFLLVGTLLWMVGLGGLHRNPRLLVSVIALLVAGGVLFVVSGSEARNRLLASGTRKASAKPLVNAMETTDANAVQPPPETEDTPFEFRLLIYQDACDLIGDFPLTGTGLGAFASDFAQYREASLSDYTVLHPESDWLMLTAEAGVPATACFAGVCWLLVRRLKGLGAHPFWPLRWGFVAAASAAALHGFVDVPAHRVALGWWVLALAGYGFQVTRDKNPTRSRVQHAVFVLGGVGALLLGGQLVRAEWFGGAPLPPFAAARAGQEIVAAFDRRDSEGAMNMARDAAKVSPMSASLYYQWGVLLLHFADTDAEVDNIFKAQRLLNPTRPQVPLQQGDAWVTVDPQRTAALWLDALERHRRMDHPGMGLDPSGSTVNYYGELLARAKPYPDVQRALGGLASQNPAYTLAWLDGVPATLMLEQLDALTKNADLLHAFSPSQRQQFLLTWYAKGNREAMARFLGDHADWQAAAWPVHLRELIDGQRFEPAVREAAEHYRISLLLPPPTPTEPADATSPPEPMETTGDVPAEFERYWRDGDSIAAHRALEEATDTIGEQSPPVILEYWRLRTALAAHDGDWPAAWQHVKHYVQQASPSESLP